MSKIKIECFEHESELVGFESDYENSLVFEFSGEQDGYISLGNLTAKFTGRVCEMDIRTLYDGEHTPHLILLDRIIDLPRLKKEYGAVSMVDPSISEIRDISLREKRLLSRVEALESKMEEISKKVFGSKLFEILP